MWVSNFFFSAIFVNKCDQKVENVNGKTINFDRMGLPFNHPIDHPSILGTSCQAPFCWQGFCVY